MFHLTECFGPVLGVMRAADLDEAIRWQNQPAYGLTAGLHALDPAEIDHWRERGARRQPVRQPGHHRCHRAPAAVRGLEALGGRPGRQGRRPQLRGQPRHLARRAAGADPLRATGRPAGRPGRPCGVRRTRPAWRPRATPSATGRCARCGCARARARTPRRGRGLRPGGGSGRGRGRGRLRCRRAAGPGGGADRPGSARTTDAARTTPGAGLAAGPTRCGSSARSTMPPGWRLSTPAGGSMTFPSPPTPAGRCCAGCASRRSANVFTATATSPAGGGVCGAVSHADPLLDVGARATRLAAPAGRRTRGPVPTPDAGGLGPPAAALRPGRRPDPRDGLSPRLRDPGGAPAPPQAARACGCSRAATWTRVRRPGTRPGGRRRRRPDCRLRWVAGGPSRRCPPLAHLDVHAGGRGHTHLDLRYLLAVDGDDEPAPPAGESQDVRWFALAGRPGHRRPGPGRLPPGPSRRPVALAP